VNTYTFTTLTKGLNYQFKYTAVNAEGESDSSDISIIVY